MNHESSPASKSTAAKRARPAEPALRLLLVPLDFSGKSRQALRYAVPLARKFGSRIVLLHVVEPVYSASPEAGLLLVTPEQTDSAMERLEEMAATYVPAAQRGPNVVQVGNPYVQILATAERMKVDLIALTTHGRTGLKRFLVGSTAEQVMRHSLCPVLSVRRQ